MNVVRRKLKPLVISIALSAAIFSVPVSASSVRSMIDSIYSGTITQTDPDSFELSNGRQSYSFGAVSVRFRNKPFNLINFQAPSVSVGCGGIDFFAGSMSVMSKDELIQAGRGIAAGATVYAFRLALNSICSSCMSIMSNIQAIMDNINQLAQTDCNSALQALESIEPSSDPADSEEANKAFKASIAGKAGEWVENKVKAHGNWLQLLADEGMDYSDVTKPQLLIMLGPSSFYIAHNSGIAPLLFPFIDDEDHQVAATASLFANADTCPDKANNNPAGFECLIPGEFVHNYIDFYTGSLIDDDDGDKGGVAIPKCLDADDHRDDKKRKHRVCVGKEGKYYAETPLTRLEPVATALMKGAYGSAAKDGMDTVDLIGKMCPDNRPTKEPSLFSKLITLDDVPLTLHERQLASQLGTQFTRDLYKMDKDGTVIADVNMIDCGKSFNAFNLRVRRLVHLHLNSSVSNINRAIKHTENNPMLSTEIRELIVKRLKEIRLGHLTSIETFNRETKDMKDDADEKEGKE